MQKNLIQAKFLFEKAQMLWEPYREISNGLVVSLLQDAAEIALWAIVKSRDVQVKDKEQFVSIIESSSSSGLVIHGKAQILELNRSRVLYKHFGLSPAASDVPRFIESASFFLRENVRQHLALDFDTVSLADEISDVGVRTHLKEAEHFRNEGDLKEALIQASIAFQKILNVAQRVQFGDLPRTDDAYQLFPRESQESARVLLSDFGYFWERFSRAHAMFTLGVDRALFDEIDARCVTVNTSQGGERLGVYMHQKTTITPENVNYLISNITDIGRRLSASLL